MIILHALRNLRGWFRQYRKILMLENRYMCSISIQSAITGGPSNIIIGEGTRINRNANIRCKNGKIVIGRNVYLAQNVTLLAQTYEKDTSINVASRRAVHGEITIKDGAWLGVNCVIMPGVVIGENSIVGANAVVTRNIPDGETWVGVPARRVK